MLRPESPSVMTFTHRWCHEHQWRIIITNETRAERLNIFSYWGRTKQELTWTKVTEEVQWPGKFWNMSQHSPNQSKLHSGNKHFKSCLLEFRLFTRRHYDNTISASSDPFIVSDHREISLFCVHIDLVRQIHSVYVYLLVTVTIYWF